MRQLLNSKACMHVRAPDMLRMPLEGPRPQMTEDVNKMPWQPCLVHGQHGVGIQIRWTGG